MRTASNFLVLGPRAACSIQGNSSSEIGFPADRGASWLLASIGRCGGSTRRGAARGIVTRRGPRLSGYVFYLNQRGLARILQSLLSSLKCASMHKWLSTRSSSI